MNKINTTTLLIVSVFFAVFILIVAFALVFRSGPVADNAPSTQITPVASPSPTRAPTPKGESFTVVRTSPLESNDVFYLTIQPVEFLFSGIVSPQNLRYKVEPPVETLIQQGSVSNSLIISPKTTWTPGLTRITILSTTKSINNETLYPEYIYNLNTADIPVPQGDFNY